MVTVVCKCSDSKELQAAVGSWCPYQISLAVQLETGEWPVAHLLPDSALCELRVPLTK